ncbi:permease for cytosine/purines, uracil, thiamine, allantoin-domain-containing protein [Ilyonectria sp. MPI-CAGE-AT-0026]|nr:permease for cytosine/purines, uracil, thiamine, allantoin-domain-containing protein [Ilyonectria sp. MPI-CAGE-AT-0026]
MPSFASNVWQLLSSHGVELRGAEPVPVEERIDTRYLNIATLFSTASLSLLTISIGFAYPLVFGLSLAQAAPMIICLNLLFCAPSAYILTIAPRVGMRQLIQFRYVYGKYCNMIISGVSMIALAGFGVLGSVSGGQALASVNPGDISVTGGICIVLVSASVMGLMGYKVLHLYARYAWIPALIGFVILIGCAGDKLSQQMPSSAVGSKPYLAAVSNSAGIMFSVGGIIGDFACYMPPEAPKTRLFLYCIGGLAIPFSLVMVAGAAIGGATLAIPAWTAAFTTGGVGGILAEILVGRLGGFGKFILVVIAWSVVPACVRDLYSVTVAIPAMAPILRRVPRVIITVIVTAAMIGVAISASNSFIVSLSSLLSIISYQSGSTTTIFLLEWLIIRKANPASFDPEVWNDGKALPSGIPALLTTAISWGPIVCGMSTGWYVGPIGRKVGDLGFEFAVIVSLLVYIPLRTMEIKYRGRL